MHMFISKLNDIIENYDKYGFHRLNGLKVVYVLLILFAINMIFTIPNPYFYYFYLPLTAMGAEVIGDTIKAKYWLFFCTVIGSIIAVFLFNLTMHYQIFFLFFAFFFATFLYLGGIYLKGQMLVPVPLILSLAVYSLQYGMINTNFYAILNNSLTTLLAMLIIMAALLFFPQSLYFRLWLRSYILLLKQILGNLLLIQDNQEVKIEPVQGHLIHLVRFSNMLPRKLPIFTILKLNILVNELRVISCVTDQKTIKINSHELQTLITNLHILISQVEKEQYCTLPSENNLLLTKIINTWNQLCQRL